MAEERTVQRLPIAAMDEDNDVAVVARRKYLDGVARAGPVGHRVEQVLSGLAIRLRVTRPAGDQGRMFGDSRPVVVSSLVVDIRSHNCRPRRMTCRRSRSS